MSTELEQSKMNIFDGINQVKSISILCLVKDNEKWLKYAFDRFCNMEKQYNVNFSYFFFENNSKDNSREMLQSFVSSRSGIVFTDTLPPFKNLGVNYERINRLAGLRNRLLDSVRPLTTDWTLFIDTDIYFGIDSIARLFATEPAKNDIVMVTPYAKEIYTGKTVKKQNKGLSGVDDSTIFTVNHYYDTFAFVDMQDKNFWPNCNFQACKRCADVRTLADKTSLIPASQEVVDVRSAFGGFSIIQSQYLNESDVRWRTIDLFGKYAICEHIAFCDTLRLKSGKRVVVAQKVNDVSWIKENE